ncbi:ABC-type maltose transport systems, permease component [Raoultella terrigena]|uniref:ABC-type maltose transport systems, permease component n=1 Tax=Raoultella terrigena TaxID=577 RepID=A0A485AVB4_RAOTE|nr:ABC-type maltose transport systems, permease component [Raoultella terrigena]
MAESWFFPHSLPSQWGLKYWYQVFSPYSDVSGSLLTSVLIAVLSVLVCLLVSIPAGYALSRRGMPLRVGFMLLFLIPQAFPNLTVYMNIAGFSISGGSTAPWPAWCWCTACTG